MQNIHIHKTLKELPSYIPPNSGVYIIIDNNLKQYYNHLNSFHLIEIAASEKRKTLQTVEFLTRKLLDKGADRNCFIIGIGGGITTDITGFTASVYKRGVRFGFVPTTLLAQVDASIGGKNGVNFQAYKNILGVINQPEWIYVSPGTLATLSPREFRAGIAEVLKTFILFDAGYYQKAVEYFTSLEAHLKKYGTYLAGGNGPVPENDSSPIYGQEILTGIIAKCAAYKCAVVERDEFEKGERRMLNLGHTFAHAIEKLCGDAAGNGTESGKQPNPDSTVLTPVMHGEAVSIGMVLAARIAAQIAPEECDPSFAERLAEDLSRTGLPVEIPAGLNMKELVDAIAKDKKVNGADIHFILPKGLENIEDKCIPLKQLEELTNDLR